MAIILPSALIADIRGGVGDVVFARGPGGACVRARTFPDETETDPRKECRDALRIISKAWSADLNDQQRRDWTAYAQEWPRPNRLGGGTHGHGYPCFIRHNWYAGRIWQEVSYADPPRSGPISPPITTMTANGAAHTITIQLPPANYNPPPFGLYLYLALGHGCNVGRAFYRSPWRYQDWNDYWTSWTKNPWTVTPALGLAAGQRIFGYLVAQYSDTGEMSTPFQLHADSP